MIKALTRSTHGGHDSDQDMFFDRKWSRVQAHTKDADIRHDLLRDLLSSVIAKRRRIISPSQSTDLPLPRHGPQGKTTIEPQYLKHPRRGNGRKRIGSDQRLKWPTRRLPVLRISTPSVVSTEKKRSSVPITHARNVLQGIDGSSVLATALRTSGYGESSSAEVVRLCTKNKTTVRYSPRTPTMTPSRSMFGSSKSAMAAMAASVRRQDER